MCTLTAPQKNVENVQKVRCAATAVAVAAAVGELFQT